MATCNFTVEVIDTEAPVLSRLLLSSPFPFFYFHPLIAPILFFAVLFPPLTPACPSNINAVADAGVCNVTVLFSQFSYADNCAIQSTTLLTPLGNGSRFLTGVSTVMYNALDTAGLGSNCSFTVTVADNQAPTISSFVFLHSYCRSLSGFLEPEH